MRTILILLTVFLGTQVFAQELKSNSYEIQNQSFPLKFVIKNNRFSVTLIEGDYIIEGDSITFATDIKTSFNVNYSNNNEQSHDLYLKFKNNKNLFNYHHRVYYGVKENDSIKYTQLTYEQLFDDNVENKKSPYSTIILPKTDTLYFAFKKRGKNKGYITEKYAIPNNINEVLINFKYVFDNDIAKSFYNKKEDYFLFKKDTLRSLQKIAYQKPINRNASYTGEFLINNAIEIDQDLFAQSAQTDKAASAAVKDAEKVVTADNVSEDLLVELKDDTSNKNWVFPDKFSNLKKAIKSLQKENILVVLNQQNKPNSKKAFDEFVINFNNQINNAYIKDVVKNEESGDESSIYQFYYATSKDKKLLDKIGIGQGVSFINKYKNVLYSNNDGLFANDINFYYESTLFYKGIKLNYFSLFDNEVKKANLTKKEFMTTVSKVVESANDLASYGYKIDQPNYAVASQNIKENSSYKILSDPKDAEKIITSFIKQNNQKEGINIEYLNFLLESYVIQNDLFKTTLNKSENIITDLDIEVYRYVLSHSKFINEETKKNKTQISTYISNYLHSITLAFSNGKNTNQYKAEIAELMNKVLEAYNYSPEVIATYISILTQNDPEQKFPLFDAYFSKIFLNKKSIIEQLNTMYEDTSYSFGWSYFKTGFSRYCNNIAWDVYEKNDTKYVLKAIQWSKTSLEIDPNNPLYLDTLAHLYFINNQKEEALKVQEKAVEYAEKNQSTYQSELKESLEKMKNK